MNQAITIPWAQPYFLGNEETYLIEAFRSTWISGGSFVERFEKDFADYLSIPFALTASNGTTAIHMAYLALGIGNGDEIIVPGFAFLAAANIALHMGAKPVFAEVDPHTWCISAREIERCISPKTKAIVPVHTYGNVCEMDDILAIAKHYGIAVIEDVAEAFPSRYKGRLAGNMGTIGAFSFQATKTITTGEGGMVVTRDHELHNTMWLYRNHGMKSRRYWHELAGYNFRMTNLQAAMGCAQMEKLDVIVSERKRVHTQYTKLLSNSGGLTLQFFPPEVETVLWSCAVKLEEKAFPQGRDNVIEQFASMGIETRPGFYAASLIDIYDTPTLPICEDISRHVISLPTYPSLRNDQIELICSKFMSLRK